MQDSHNEPLEGPMPQAPWNASIRLSHDIRDATGCEMDHWPLALFLELPGVVVAVDAAVAVILVEELLAGNLAMTCPRQLFGY